jgi:hypothetical protein
MSRNENAKHRDVDERYDQSRPPLHAPHGLSALRDDRNTVDDDLHQELYLKDP